MMPHLEPHHHRMIVSLASHILIGPLICLRGVGIDSSGRVVMVYLDGVVVVSQIVPIFVVSSLLLDAQVPALWKGDDLGLIRFLEHEQMIELSELVGLQVQEQQFVTASIDEYAFSWRKHAHCQHRFGKNVLKEEFSLAIHMKDCIFAWTQHHQHEKSVIFCRVQEEHTSHSALHFDLKSIADYHRTLYMTFLRSIREAALRIALPILSYLYLQHS